MIILKDYQNRVLDSLRDFLGQAARDQHPDGAFQAVQVANGIRQPSPYLPVHVPGFSPEMPYVCLRVPTGGGKTLLACYASGMAIREFNRTDNGVVLWLVPSNAILEQTAQALRDPRHDYRRALEMACGSVEVVTIDEALNLSRARMKGQTVVIVSTIQSFRVEDKTGRKVYGQNGSLTEHFQPLPTQADVVLGPDGQPIPSLVNVLRLHRPVVIVDEAHNARTDLSFATLGGVLPSCIIEFTATPARKKNPSNVLHLVSAMELKAENMVKLPLRVFSRHPSQKDQLLAEAISVRADLENAATLEGQATGEYLRPILLFQAESVSTCEPLRERLVAEFAIPKDQVKISVGSKNELPDGDEIAKPTCPIRFIITVQRLREGWDCPFAYVLCSLRATRSVTAIEQIVGRILRLPKALPKRNPDLNCSYAFSISPTLGEVLNELREALVQNGFTRAEAEGIVLPPPIQPTLGVQPQTVQFGHSELNTATVGARIAELGSKVIHDPAKRQITVLVPLDAEETATLTACATTKEAKAKIERAVTAVRAADLAFGGSGQTRIPSPYQQRKSFKVPLLSVREGQLLFEFESTFLIEQPWQLSAKDASLSPDYNPLEKPLAYSGMVDVGKSGKIKTGIIQATQADNFVGKLHQQMLGLNMPANWTIDRLVSWLDSQIRHEDIPPGESSAFLGNVVRGLMAKYGIADLDSLAADRHRLRDEVERRIQQHRELERDAAFQAFLLPNSDLTVSEDHALDFGILPYEPSWVYEGDFQFKKHFYGPKVGELGGSTSKGKIPEEFQCAQYLDSMPEVEYWVRNLVRKSGSFRLQTSKDWFYPDFVCKLTDGRVLVVEYKGAHLYAGAEEKRLVGAVWAARSGGKCLFVMPTDNGLATIGKAIRGG